MKVNTGKEMGLAVEDMSVDAVEAMTLGDKRVMITQCVGRAWPTTLMSFDLPSLFDKLGSRVSRTGTGSDPEGVRPGKGIKMQFMKDMHDDFEFGFDLLPDLNPDDVAGPDDAALLEMLSPDSAGSDSDDDSDGSNDDALANGLTEVMGSDSEASADESDGDRLAVDDGTDGLGDCDPTAYDLDFVKKGDYLLPEGGDHVALWYPEGWFAAVVYKVETKRKKEPFSMYVSDGTWAWCAFREDEHGHTWQLIGSGAPPQGCDLEAPSNRKRGR